MNVNDCVHTRLCLTDSIVCVCVCASGLRNAFPIWFCMLNIMTSHTQTVFVNLWWLAFCCWNTHLMSDVVGLTIPKLGLSRITVSTTPCSVCCMDAKLNSLCLFENITACDTCMHSLQVSKYGICCFFFQEGNFNKTSCRITQKQMEAIF